MSTATATSIPDILATWKSLGFFNHPSLAQAEAKLAALLNSRGVSVNAQHPGEVLTFKFPSWESSTIAQGDFTRFLQDAAAFSFGVLNPTGIEESWETEDYTSATLRFQIGDREFELAPETCQYDTAFEFFALVDSLLEEKGLRLFYRDDTACVAPFEAFEAAAMQGFIDPRFSYLFFQQGGGGGGCCGGGCGSAPSTGGGCSTGMESQGGCSTGGGGCSTGMDADLGYSQGGGCSTSASSAPKASGGCCGGGCG